MTKNLSVTIADRVHKEIEEGWKQEKQTRSEFVEEMISVGLKERRLIKNGLLNKQR